MRARAGGRRHAEGCKHPAKAIALGLEAIATRVEAITTSSKKLLY